MTEKAPADKAPVIGDPVAMPADEQVAENISRISGRSDVPRTVPLTKEMVDEKHSAKSAESKDELVVDINAEPAPAGYDKQGNVLRTQRERLLAGAPTPEARQELDDKLADIDRKANADKTAAKKVVEESTYKATGSCQKCRHSSEEHPNGKACKHSTATLECDCTAFVAPS